MTARNRRWVPLALLGAGIAYRALHLYQLSALPDWDHPRADEEYYLRAAADLGAGVCRPFHLSPLFISLLSLMQRSTGVAPLPFRLLFGLCGIATALLLHDLVRRRLGETPALWALGLSLFCGPLLYYESNLDVATVASFLTLCALYAAERWRTAGDGIGWWILAGVATGLSIVARPNAALLIPLLAIAPFLLRSRLPFRRRAVLALVAPAFAVAVTLPVLFHNHRCTGEWIWITDSGGMNFYIGNHAAANGTFNVPPRVPAARNVDSQERAFADEATRAFGHPLTRAEINAYWTRATLDEIRADPRHWIALLARKLLMVFNDEEISNTRSYAFRAERVGSLGPWLVQVGYITPLALLGLAFWLRRPREHLFPLGFTLLFIGALTLFFVLGHYREVLLPLFLYAAVSAAHELFALHRDGRHRALLSLLVALGLATWIVHRPVPGSAPELERAGEAFRLALTLDETGDLPAAERWYLEALAPQPDQPLVLRQLALLYSRTDRPDLALPLWRRLLAVATRQGDRLQIDEASRFVERLSANRRAAPQ